ncbi:MAG: glutaredoxin domain-containing protein [Chloroflexota bacterium]
MSESTITIYATDWCFDCRRTRKFLERHAVPYQWINIDKDRQAEAYVLQINRGNRSVPTVVFPDGSVLVEPSDSALAEKLGV